MPADRRDTDLDLKFWDPNFALPFCLPELGDGCRVEDMTTTPDNSAPDLLGPSNPPPAGSAEPVQVPPAPAQPQPTPEPASPMQPIASPPTSSPAPAAREPEPVPRPGVRDDLRPAAPERGAAVAAAPTPLRIPTPAPNSNPAGEHHRAIQKSGVLQFATALITLAGLRPTDHAQVESAKTQARHPLSVLGLTDVERQQIERLLKAVGDANPAGLSATGLRPGQNRTEVGGGLPGQASKTVITGMTSPATGPV